MSESKELNKIKKIYGERFMHLCRTLFPTILETEGRLLQILTMHLANNTQTLYEDIAQNKLEEQFKNYIYSKIDMEDEEKKLVEPKTPYQLLDEAGYILYECTTEEEIQAFRKYYAEGEKLCTFAGGRLDSCVVYFAVRKDVETIKRKDYQNPQREDKYGTSVMGIQFSKYGLCTVSIKNRYNHRVNNPDATYGNDLDRIIPGLTRSFSEELLQKGLELNSSNVELLEIPGYVVANDGKYYKYNMEINGVYFCPGNIVIEYGNVVKIENSKMLIDYFIVDNKNKIIKPYRDLMVDAFADDLIDIDKIEIVKNKENDTRIIYVYKKGNEEAIEIEIDKTNQIIGYKNNGVKELGFGFLKDNKKLSKLELPNVKCITDQFLFHNQALTTLKLSKVETIGRAFLYNNRKLFGLELPEVTYIGDSSLANNQELTKLVLPKVVTLGAGFLHRNKILQYLDVPCLLETTFEFLSSNRELKFFNAPKLEKIEARFLSDNKELEELELASVKYIGNEFMYVNNKLTSLIVPQLDSAGQMFLPTNTTLNKLIAPKLRRVWNSFLRNNDELTELDLPELKNVSNDFLSKNKKIKRFIAPNLKRVGDAFLASNQELTYLSLPNLKEVGDKFLYFNNSLKEIEFLSLKFTGNKFLYSNECLKILNTPELEDVGDYFLYKNQEITETELYTQLEYYGDGFFEKNPHLGRNSQEKIEEVNSQSMAILDKNTELTTAELIWAKRVLDNIQEKGQDIDRK